MRLCIPPSHPRVRVCSVYCAAVASCHFVTRISQNGECGTPLRLGNYLSGAKRSSFKKPATPSFLSVASGQLFSDMFQVVVSKEMIVASPPARCVTARSDLELWALLTPSLSARKFRLDVGQLVTFFAHTQVTSQLQKHNVRSKARSRTERTRTWPAESR